MCIRNAKVTKGGGLTIRCTEWAYYPYNVRAHEFGAYVLFLIWSGGEPNIHIYNS